MQVTGPFLESCEANFLRLYLYAEHTKFYLDEQTRSGQLERGAHHRTLEAYVSLEDVYRESSIYNEGLKQEYERLQGAYAALQSQYEILHHHCDGLQRYIDYLAPPDTSQQNQGGDPPLRPGAVLAGAPTRK